MEYQITQVITYWVKAETPDEALELWNNHPKTGVTEWKDDTIELSDEHVEINC